MKERGANNLPSKAACYEILHKVSDLERFFGMT
jgi:hypothetical protein